MIIYVSILRLNANISLSISLNLSFFAQKNRFIKAVLLSLENRKNSFGITH